MKKTTLKAVTFSVLLTFSLIVSACSSNETSQEPPPGNQPASNETQPTQSTSNSTQTTSTSEDELKFFNGKTLTLIVATNPGSSYDFYARALAPILEKNLPGSTIIVENVSGAGGATGAAKVFNAQPDGLTIGTFSSAAALLELTGSKAAEFKMKEYTWIGNMARMPRVIVVRNDTPFQTVEDLKNASSPAKMPSSGAGSAAQNDALMLNELLGLNIEIIPGYGGAESDMAWQRGEIDLRIGGFGDLQKHVDDNEGKVLLQMTGYPAEEFATTFPHLLEIPTLGEVAPADKKEWVDFMNALSDLARPLAAPPGIPEGRAEVMREAIAKSFADPELIDVAKKANMPIDFQSHEEVEKMMGAIMDAPSDLISFLKEISAN